MKTTLKEKPTTGIFLYKEVTTCRMRFCLLCMIALSVQTVFAQGKVKGTVTDGNNDSLIGVNILVKGTTVGTITDINGQYEIDAPADVALIFKYIGYQDKEVQVGKQTIINVVMTEDAQSLDEVVVVGYGTVKKRDLTGAVSSVGADKLKERSFGNALQSMAGQVSGVQITQTQGAPGMAPTIKVRGSSSINAGTSPLYVIDGIPLEDNTVSDGSNGSPSNMTFNTKAVRLIPTVCIGQCSHHSITELLPHGEEV